MAKITISRIYELSKALATKSGQELQGPLTYLSELAEVTLRNLRNGLTFADNLDCETKRIFIKNNTETIISITSQNRRAQRIYIDRAVDQNYYVVDSFGWKYNSSGEIVVKIGFANSPPANLDITVDIVIHFG